MSQKSSVKLSGEDEKLTFIRKEYLRTGSYNPFQDVKAFELWYVYKDQKDQEIRSNEILHGEDDGSSATHHDSSIVLKFNREKYMRTGSYNPFKEVKAFELWHVYKDQKNEEFISKQKKYGGKRKSRRNRKSNKSRKNLRKSNRRC